MGRHVGIGISAVWGGEGLNLEHGEAEREGGFRGEDSFVCFILGGDGCARVFGWRSAQWGECWPGLAKLAIGAVMLWGIAPLIDGLLAGWVGMIGMVLMLHFGVFHLLAVFWNARGVGAEPIMDRPLCARTLAEFWGERWNRAFNELMFRFVFRPALRELEPTWALLFVFLVSGLIHDLVISVPAGGGYGLPTLYFLVQAVGLLAQRTRTARLLGMGASWGGRLFTGVVLLGPLPLLFHAEFIERVILPFMEVIGAAQIGG